MLAEPSGPGQEDWVTFTFKFERLDGTPAEPPSFQSTMKNVSLGGAALALFQQFGSEL